MLVSAIIPCKDEKYNIDALLQNISDQKTFFETEVIKVANISPPGKARNSGAKKAKGGILVFIDCDIRLGNELFLANLVKPLIENKNIGAVCASLRMPIDSSKFQIHYAREVPHSQSPIVNKLTDIQVASSACFSIYKELFFKIGGFNEDIIRGEDSVLSDELIRAGYRVVLAPQTWCYHAQPRNMRELIKTSFRNGSGVCFVDTFYPCLNLDVHPKGIAYFSKKKSIFERINRFLSGGIEAIFKIRILLFFSKIFYGVGYFYGFFKYRIRNLK